MADIIIDGVDVSKCMHFRASVRNDNGNLERDVCRNRGYYNCHNQPCAFKCKVFEKRLVCKTQELYCAKNEIHSKTEYIQEQRDIIEQLTQESEELKEKIKAYEKPGGIIEEGIAWKLNADFYYNVLEEIEEYCKNEISITGDLPFRTTASDILDIISSTKQRKNNL